LITGVRIVFTPDPNDSKTIANLLGICERQVNYYINCARKEYELKLLESTQNEE
jgi:hypothetical protein